MTRSTPRRSSRCLSSVARGLQPWRRETFKFSTDPELEAKVRDVVGLYLDPPEKAVMVEILFSIITRPAIRRGTFTSAKNLIAAIGTDIDAWNERCQPFTWTKTADETLTKATAGQRSSFTRH